MKIGMSENKNTTSKGSFFQPDLFSCLLSVAAVAAVIFAASVNNFSQSVLPTPTPIPVKLTSAEYISQDGLTVEKLLELGANRRADLQAARQRLAIAEGRLQQARFRPNPTLSGEYGTARILGAEDENALSVGITQVFETGGKRNRRAAVAELELQQIRAEVSALERRLAVEIRTAYTNALSAARQLDVLEKLIVANLEIVRVIEARLKEGDVAPLDVNLVKVEADRLKIQTIQARNDLETALLQLKTLIGAELAEAVKLAPQTERPPRLDLGLSELTELALKERADLQAARLGENLGTARINLAKANSVPNVAGSITYSRNQRITDFPPVIGGSVTNRDNELTFGVTVDIPVFNRNQGAIASATGEKLQATRSREFLEATIKRDVAVAYRKYRAAAETLTIYAVQIIPRSEENLKSIRAAYGFGEFSVFEVVNEQRRLTENVTGYNQSLRDYYNALNELETALGAGVPPTGLTPVSSILPSEDLAPSQASREKLLKSIETVEIPKKIEVSKNKEQEEEEKE
jgi:cobalt-zinc-cadmium efflux system outer membrane protein